MATAKSKTVYDVHPSVAMMQKRLAELREESGRSTEECLALVKKEGPKGEKSRRDWLKSKHKLGPTRHRGLRNSRKERAGKTGRRRT